jgi:lipopolysaccharide/colanic/teichoic acid biosynthesis glycosyltransferase
MTTGSPASSTETTELVVPRSIPTAFAMVLLLLFVVLMLIIGGILLDCQAGLSGHR